MFAFGRVPLRLRECMNKDGTEKKVFSSGDEAQRAIDRAGWAANFRPYQCSRGHWHVGRKYRAWI